MVEENLNTPIVPDDPNRQVITTQGYLKTLHDEILDLNVRISEQEAQMTGRLGRNESLRKAEERIKLLEKQPTASEDEVFTGPLIVQLHLASGKGTVVCRNWNQVKHAITLFVEMGATISIERP